MTRKSKITTHALRIRRLLLDGKNARTIWKELQALGVLVSYEGVRKWIHANPVEGIVLNGPGRPRSIEANAFDFLPDNLSDLPATKTPAFLLPFAAIYAGPESFRLEVTKRAMWQLGLPYHDSVPRMEWILPADRMVRCSDLEYCIIAYMVSNLPPPPLSGNLHYYEEWFEKLMAGAMRLKEAARQGYDTTGTEIFDE